MLGMHFSIIYFWHDGISETKPFICVHLGTVQENNQGGIPAARHHAVPLQSLAPL